MKIWKFEIPVQDSTEILFPKGARIVEVERIHPLLLAAWVEVPETWEEEIPVEVQIVGTGHEIKEGLRHLATVQDSPFVWHVYVGPGVRIR